MAHRFLEKALSLPKEHPNDEVFRELMSSISEARIENLGNCEQMSLVPPNNILEEEIFTLLNLGPDCDFIGGLLERFSEKFNTVYYANYSRD